MQHGQNRRRPDSRTEQHNRALTGLQNEASAWRTNLEIIADADMVPQVRSSDPIRLDLHADSIALGPRFSESYFSFESACAPWWSVKKPVFR